MGGNSWDSTFKDKTMCLANKSIPEIRRLALVSIVQEPKYVAYQGEGFPSNRLQVAS